MNPRKDPFLWKVSDTVLAFLFYTFWKTNLCYFCFGLRERILSNILNTISWFQKDVKWKCLRNTHRGSIYTFIWAAHQASVRPRPVNAKSDPPVEAASTLGRWTAWSRPGAQLLGPLGQWAHGHRLRAVEQNRQSTVKVPTHRRRPETPAAPESTTRDPSLSRGRPDRERPLNVHGGQPKQSSSPRGNGSLGLADVGPEMTSL